MSIIKTPKEVFILWRCGDSNPSPRNLSKTIYKLSSLTEQYRFLFLIPLFKTVSPAGRTLYIAPGASYRMSESDVRQVTPRRRTPELQLCGCQLIFFLRIYEAQELGLQFSKGFLCLSLSPPFPDFTILFPFLWVKSGSVSPLSVYPDPFPASL